MRGARVVQAGRRATVVAALAAAVAGLAACGGGGAGDGSTIVVSTGIWGDVVREVVGDCADVEVLVPAGADPHAFELSARGAASLHEADLVVVNGLGLEARLEDPVDDARRGGVPVLELGEQLDPIRVDDGDDGDGEGDEGDADPHGHGGFDAHVWQDPERVARAAELIAEEVGRHTACDPAAVEARAARYAEELRELDRELRAELEAIPEADRRLVTNHDAFRYFADTYGFEVVGTVIPSATTLAEPGSAELAELAELVETTGVPAIFVESSQSAALAEALAAEVDRPVEVVELHADVLGDEGSGADRYIGLMRTNVARIRDALTPG